MSPHNGDTAVCLPELMSVEGRPSITGFFFSHISQRALEKKEVFRSSFYTGGGWRLKCKEIKQLVENDKADNRQSSESSLAPHPHIPLPLCASNKAQLRNHHFLTSMVKKQFCCSFLFDFLWLCIKPNRLCSYFILTTTLRRFFYVWAP